jgi:hypothetical protein
MGNSFRPTVSYSFEALLDPTIVLGKFIFRIPEGFYPI